MVGTGSPGSADPSRSARAGLEPAMQRRHRVRRRRRTPPWRPRRHPQPARIGPPSGDGRL